jgi:cell division protein FtsI/penicillin-binding protein 2
MFYEIYAYTGDRRYYLLGSAMSNVADFLGDVANEDPKKMKGRLQEKIGVLRELGKSLKELTKYQTPESIPYNLAEELFNLSEGLW